MSTPAASGRRCTQLWQATQRLSPFSTTSPRRDLVRLHLEGMGLLGSLLARRLHGDGIGFTWHDTDHPHAAWRACAGLVYPAGDARSARNLPAWTDWWAQSFLPPGTVEPAHYVFTHQRPPHDARYRTEDLGPGLTLAQATAFAVDVPALVTATRTRFAEHRHPAPPADATVLVRAHGHHRATAGWSWGWTAPVQLQLPGVLEELPHRPALYARRMRLVHAYPIPSRPGWWWAGGARIPQTRPRTLDAAQLLRRWIADWAQLWPRVEVLTAETPVQGWRPQSADPHDGAVARTTTSRGPVLTLPALDDAGLRWAPEVVDATLTELARIRETT